MVLQKLLFPTEEICTEKDLYMRGSEAVIQKDFVRIDIPGRFETDTYFNSFSVKKWKKYSVIENLKLRLEIEGKCDIYLCFAWIDDSNIIRRKGDNVVFAEKRTEIKEELIFEFPDHSQAVIAYFKIVPKEGSVKLYSAEYFTDVKENDLPDIKIALGICTYKREEFINKNIGLLNKNILSNPDSSLHKKLDIFISDNGQSLKPEKFNHPEIHLFRNQNTGGSGGFTRCMIEVKKLQSEKGYTHILLMDDDILLDTSVLERTYALLRLLKSEFRDAMVGGAMLILDKKYQQFENAALYENGKLSFKNKNIDLRTIRNILQNEIEYDRNYNAWCYCCMPLEKITADNLPLPFFIHMDDVEYGARNHFQIITLNGISVWHPFYTNQRGASIVYYDVRNKLVTMAELGGRHIQEYAMEWLNIFYRSIFNFDYERTLASCRAIQDFCKGIDYFKQIDPISLNIELSKYNLPWTDADEGIENLVDNKQSVKDISRRSLVKNYFTPARKEFVVMDCNIADAYPYHVKKLILYNCVTKKQCVYEKSFRKMVECRKECRKTKKIIKKRIISVAFEWKDRLQEITNVDFWTKYLEI